MIPEDVRAHAVMLVAEGAKTHDEITAALEIGRTTLANWKADPEFRDQVKQFRQRVYEEVIEGGIGDLKRRIIERNKRYAKLLRVIDERAADPEMADIPGGTTGLVVKRERTIHTGKDDYERVTEHEVDTGLLDYLEKVEQAAATELGQWKQKVEHTVDDETRRVAAVLTKFYSREQIESARKKLLDLAQPPKE